MDIDTPRAADQAPNAAPPAALVPSRHFMAAAVKRVRWLPCAPADVSAEDLALEGLPAVLAVWSSDAQVHTKPGSGAPRLQSQRAAVPGRCAATSTRPQGTRRAPRGLRLRPRPASRPRQRWLRCAQCGRPTQCRIKPLPPADATAAPNQTHRQSFMLAVGDAVRQPGSSDMVSFADKLVTAHTGNFTDLQVAGRRRQ